jgi:hypothetical protein
MRVLLFLPLTFAFACLALLSLLAFLGVMILARTLQVMQQPDQSLGHLSPNKPREFRTRRVGSDRRDNSGRVEKRRTQIELSRTPV